MRILVLGASGMAGHVVSYYFKENGYDVFDLAAREKIDENTTLIDVTNFNALANYLNSNNFDVVINCIGILVKESDKKKDLAVLINSYLPHFLEKFYSDKKTKLIHLSTDDVFATENAPYSESSRYDSESFYGRSKALGEIINDKDLTFRMSIIGPDMRKNGIGLFNWFASQKGTVYGYDKVLWSGITTIELARGIREAIEQNLCGIYHLVSKKNITKYNLLQLFKTEFGYKHIEIEPSNSIVLDKTLINTRKDFDFNVSDYEKMIREMKNWVASHKKLYPHYS